MPPLLNIMGKCFVFPFISTIFAVIRFDILLANRLLLLSIPPRCEMRRVFLSLPNKSNEYGTSKSPTTLHYLRCRNPRYDDSHLGNTRNYLLLQTQRFQVPNESRTQRQRPTRHRQGSMVRKQNERTILLQYRIIQLSLPTKTLFLILASRPLSTRLGAFSSPETFSRKFFPKFFPILPRRLFSGFLVRKIMGEEGA